MSDTLVVVAAFVAWLAWATALAFILARGRGRVELGALFLLASLAGIGLFTATSNVLEHLGVTTALDPYEDYVEILLVPLFIYVWYALRTSMELKRRRRAELDLQRSNRALQVLSDSLQVIARSDDEESMAQTVCGILVVVGGYAYAIIELEPDQREGISSVTASAGTGTHGREQACDEHGSTIQLALSSAGRVLGSLTICSEDPESFDVEEEARLRELADDVGYGVRALREQVARRSAEKALQDSEERYRRLVELSPDAVFVVLRGEMVYANAAGVLLLGARSAQEIAGRPAVDFVVEDERAKVFERMAEVLLSEPPAVLDGPATSGPTTTEERFVRVDGTGVDVEVARAPFVHEGELAVLVVARDITERKQVDQLKADFLSMVSHELRTPLNAIVGYVSVLQRVDPKVDESAHARALRRIPERARDMAALIDDLLNVTRIESGDLKLRRAPVDIGDLVFRCVESRPHDDMHQFELDIEEGMEEVECDAERMTYVVSNLLNNAVKFSPDGGTVTVSARTEGEDVLVSVRDEGIGISADDLPHVFDRFTQADMSLTRPFGGFGLGLYIARKIMEAHDGGVTAQSTPGQGSVFTVRLPR